jgi:hypothetical protein
LNIGLLCGKEFKRLDKKVNGDLNLYTIAEKVNEIIDFLSKI